jgi:hypothetical protein
VESSDGEGAGLGAEDYILDDDAERAAIDACTAASYCNAEDRRRREEEEKRDTVAHVHAHVIDECRREEKGKGVVVLGSDSSMD